MYELLKPLSKGFLHFVEDLPKFTLGKSTVFFQSEKYLDYSAYDVAIIAVGDNRGFSEELPIVDLTDIRKEFYQLYPGNWLTRLVDLGDIIPGNTLKDTYYLLEQITADLIKNNILPIVLGGSQDLTYALYKGVAKLGNLVNLVSIDSKLHLKSQENLIADSFMGKIIMEEPVRLFHYTNLGYQTYYNTQEEIDLMHSLYFEGIRLGELVGDISRSEPFLREADIVSLDLSSIKSSDSGRFLPFNPNGFDGREICSLSRYSGLSDRVKIFGVFNYNNNKSEALLIAQILWYYIEGVNYRTKEDPFTPRDSYTKYIVPVEGVEDFIFYKSDLSNRWWVHSPKLDDRQKGMQFVIACSYEDYQQTLNQEIPDRWWRMLKRSLL
ncbi:formimidoylglutamase [Myroides sp. LJL115]